MRKKTKQNIVEEGMSIDDFINNDKVKELYQSDSISDFISLKEQQSSEILSYFLDVRESHGLGNNFISHLLKCIQETPFIKKLPNNELFKDSSVWTEYSVEKRKTKDKSSKNKGRIDIVCLDLTNKICLVLENKYGSKEHNKQCNTYYSALKKMCGEKIQFIYVYLDFEKPKISNQEYFLLTYEKLFNIDFEELLPEPKPSEINRWAKDLYDAFKKDFTNNYNKNYEETIEYLSRKYGNYLEKKYFNKDFNNSLKTKKGILNNYLKEPNRDFIIYYDYQWLIDEVINFKNKQAKVYTIKEKQAFKDFINDMNGKFKNRFKGIELGDFNFSDGDYESGVLTFSYNKLSINDKWFFYGEIAKNKDKYIFRYHYDCLKNKDLEKFLFNNKNKRSQSVQIDISDASPDGINELLKNENFSTFETELTKLINRVRKNEKIKKLIFK
ncbi:MAG: PD-(D/E)XK nuclease family protein [Alphaproteobacteria bacterium]|nr:PD-(D/E)XK nuclease family protein [Alphaproteobacteria bacterium]